MKAGGSRDGRHRGDNDYVLVSGHHRLEACRRTDNYVAIIVVPPELDDDDIRLWEISENLHRAELTVQERSDHTAEWVKIVVEKTAKADKAGQSGQVVRNESKREDGRGHRHAGGIAQAARELPVSGNTDEAKRKNVERAVKIASIAPEAKAAAKNAGLDNTQSVLLAVSREPTPEKQVAKIEELAAKRAQPQPKVEPEV